MANSINDLSPDIRDFLLNRNLILSDTVINNGLSTNAIGLGTQTNISTNDDAVQSSENIEESAVDFRDKVISRNRYTSTEDMVAATIINNSYSYGQRDGGYIDENKDLNFGGAGTQGLDTIDSILSQEGFGLGNDGFETQGDIRTTVAGRVLGATGGINETPLGIIGGQQLLLALGQRATFNAQRELFGKVNLQPFSLLSGSDFIVPDNSITVRSTIGGRVGDIALDVIGVNLPIDIIDDNASIFTQSVDANMGEASLLRNNSLLKYTGKGQLIRLFDNLNANKYAPDYDSDGSGRKTSKLGVNDPKEYDAKSDDIGLVNINDDNSQIYGISGTKFLWDQDYLGETIEITKKSDSLLRKTRDLFKNNDEFKLIKKALGHTPIYIPNSDELTTKMGKGWNMMSKGSGVINTKSLNGELLDDENPLDRVACRAWTSRIAYDNVSSLQKNSGLYNYGNKVRNDIEDSVLDENGFVKISPYRVPSNGSVDPYEAKKFMFSIENLAWADKASRANLPKYEIGNGDPSTGTKGRIMWFPPYDIKFTDTTAVDWDSTKFIGRGEPVYTYNNTERSGTLNFKVIIDYPDYMNDSKINTNELMASLVAGCDYNKYFSQNEINKIGEEYDANTELGKQIQVTTPTLPENFGFYFENDISTINISYESNGLNSKWLEVGFFTDLSSELRQNKGIKITINGYASKRGPIDNNVSLSQDRVTSVKNWLLTNLDSDVINGNRIKTGKAFGDSQASSVEDESIDSKNAKEDRVATITFKYDGSSDEQIQESVDVKKEKSNTQREIISKVKRRFHREDEYFEKLKNSNTNSDKIIYDNIREKIKFFHPAFHSTTPEGFNSRLTFLQQCTRQGPTNKNNKSNNLAFGKPPVCILRIGDFYHTKIVMNSLGIEYEPLVWDLNPEGVGVQPMIANINISFKFIGGSALNGPINKLQNAVSFNYFANSGVYDPRADRWVRKEEIDPKDNKLFDYLEGVKNLQQIIEDDEGVPTRKPETGIKNDEEAVAEIASDKQTEEEVTVITDKDILKNVAWDVKFNETVSPNTFSFIFNSGVGYDITSLSQEYNIILKINNPDGSWSDVLTGKLGSLNSGTITSTKTFSQNPYGIGEQTFTLIAEGGNLGKLRFPITNINVEY